MDCDQASPDLRIVATYLNHPWAQKDHIHFGPEWQVETFSTYDMYVNRQLCKCVQPCPTKIKLIRHPTEKPESACTDSLFLSLSQFFSGMDRTGLKALPTYTTQSKGEPCWSNSEAASYCCLSWLTCQLNRISPSCRPRESRPSPLGFWLIDSAMTLPVTHVFWGTLHVAILRWTCPKSKWMWHHLLVADMSFCTQHCIKVQAKHSYRFFSSKLM